MIRYPDRINARRLPLNSSEWVTIWNDDMRRSSYYPFSLSCCVMLENVYNVTTCIM